MESGAFVRECLLGGCMKTPFPIFGWLDVRDCVLTRSDNLYVVDRANKRRPIHIYLGYVVYSVVFGVFGGPVK